MIRPVNIRSAVAATGVVRAGGTDLHARRRLGMAEGEIIDLRDLSSLRNVETTDGGARLGALVRIGTLASDPVLARSYPALALAAGSLATPQIRAVATVGGNLLQQSRCPYFRHPELSCLKSGGSGCPARDGDHRHGVIFDLGPCVAPHPSTLAMTLLTYEASVVTTAVRMTIGELMGDGRDGTRDNTLPEGELLTHIELPAPVEGERGAYLRAIERSRAEWPVVEVSCRLGISDGVVEWAVVAAGGVAPIPLRLSQVEEAARGSAIDDHIRLGRAAALAVDMASPLPMTGHKVPLLVTVVRDALDLALRDGSVSERSPGERGLI